MFPLRNSVAVHAMAGS